MFGSLVVLMYGLWSTVYSFTQNTLAYSPPIFLTASRMPLPAFILPPSPPPPPARRSSFRLRPLQWLSMGVLGFFSVYLTNILECWALQYLPGAKVSFIYSLSPFF